MQQCRGCMTFSTTYMLEMFNCSLYTTTVSRFSYKPKLQIPWFPTELITRALLINRTFIAVVLMQTWTRDF